jgi:serine-type D-Ala-D-Ala carboxypeptidase/endopeptidase
LVSRLIEKPLELGSGFATADRPRAKGYDDQGVEVPPSGTAAGLRYSTADMLKYAAYQLDERREAVALCHRSTWDTLDKQQSIGFFWITSGIKRGRRLRYSGSTPGFTSFCDLYPEQDVGIVLLANNSDEGAQDRLKKVSEEIDEAIRNGATTP